MEGRVLKNTTRILFVGIYNFGSAALGRLASRGFNIIGVVTKPENTAGTQAVAGLGPPERASCAET
jgi:methionyl-tRNA formyltransferase